MGRFAGCDERICESQILKFCHIRVISNAFQNIEKLKSVYTNIDDVELSVGGIFETKIPGTLAGEVYHCIFMKQFYNTRVGDRYWFESEDADLAFKTNQLAEIRKSSMARMFCDNGNNISSMQPRAFEVLSDE